MKLLAALLVVGAVILASLWWSSADRAGPEAPLAGPATSSAGSVALASSSASDLAHLAAPALEPATVEKDADVAGGPDAASEIASTTVELEAALASFATGAPDVAALRRAVEELARTAAIDPAQVVTDDHGNVRGRFTIPGTGLAGSFTIEGKRFDVDLTTKPPHNANAAAARAVVSIATNVDAGRAAQGSVAASFYPDMGGPPDDGSTAERHIGFAAHVTDTGTTQIARAAQWDATSRSWRVTRSSELPDVEQRGDLDVRANQAWIDRLAQFQPKK